MCSAEFVFPAVKGIQAQREYYVLMVPLDAMAKLFQFSDENLPPEIRSQRVLNRACIPEIRDYILSNPESYVFSAMTVSVDGGIKFQSISEFAPQIGNISIPMTSRFLINDGQHRRAAILEAIKANADLREEHISVVFYHDEGLTRSQQIFSDLNRYAIKPTRSTNILFNSREESSIIAKKSPKNPVPFEGLSRRRERKSLVGQKQCLHLAQFVQQLMNYFTILIFLSKKKSIWPSAIGMQLATIFLVGIWSNLVS